MAQDQGSRRCLPVAFCLERSRIDSRELVQEAEDLCLRSSSPGPSSAEAAECRAPARGATTRRRREPASYILPLDILNEARRGERARQGQPKRLQGPHIVDGCRLRPMLECSAELLEVETSLHSRILRE